MRKETEERDRAIEEKRRFQEAEEIREKLEREQRTRSI